DAVGPDFGAEALMDSLAGSPTLATLVGAGDRYVWPATHGLRRIPITDPTPVYPHSLVHRNGNPHPALAALRRYLGTSRVIPPGRLWTPSWATRID
ncbi:LysR family transcriptional regulator, partial [Rhodococcus hoagii]|nr:LysR family transcriptional regulator [Prescottella equi]